MRVLGLDYGDRRIGVAVSDGLGWTATALKTIERKNPNDLKDSIEEIGRIVSEYSIQYVVLGYPKNMDGTEGENCRKVATFKDKLQKAYPNLQIEFFDERLTTARAHQIFNEVGIKVKNKGKGSIDKLAAQIILQGYLDMRR
ncbi:MAG: Holliday junction resolvase RuvX [Defluviitaleaceae bacterium]|nr:Holliday junction resolvase RuvX [Defluviitaleaceae bacterium]